MATRIRLMRIGAKKKPFYRVVVADGRTPRGGRCLEKLGYYNPLQEPAEVRLEEEKTIKWLRNGAQPSSTVKNLLVRTGIWETFTTGGQTGRETDEGTD